MRFVQKLTRRVFAHSSQLSLGRPGAFQLPEIGPMVISISVDSRRKYLKEIVLPCRGSAIVVKYPRETCIDFLAGERPREASNTDMGRLNIRSRSVIPNGR